MTIADKINWTIDHLQSKQFDNQTLNDIIEAYKNYCSTKNIEVEDTDKVKAELKGCLSRLVKDGYVTVYDFLEEPTYKISFGVGLINHPKYSERTQEDIDNEKKEIEYGIAALEARRKEARDIKRAENLKKFKTVFIKYWFAIVTGIIVAILTLIIESILGSRTRP